MQYPWSMDTTSETISIADIEALPFPPDDSDLSERVDEVVYDQESSSEGSLETVT